MIVCYERAAVRSLSTCKGCNPLVLRFFSLLLLLQVSLYASSPLPSVPKRRSF